MANRKDESSGGGAPNERPPQTASAPEGGNGGGQPSNPSSNPGQSPTPAQTAERVTRQAVRNTEETVTRAAESGRQAIDDAARHTAEFNRRATDASAQMADRSLRQAAEMARQQNEQARSVVDSSTDAYRDLADYSRADFGAVFQSSARLAQGIQEMSLEMTQFTQEQLRIGMRLANELMECRTVEDFVSVQRDFVKETVDVLLSESARILSLSSKMTNDAVNPLNERPASRVPHSDRDIGRGNASGQSRQTQPEDRERQSPPRGRDTSGYDIRQ